METKRLKHWQGTLQRSVRGSDVGFYSHLATQIHSSGNDKKQLSLAGAATSKIFVMIKVFFCHDKRMLVATKLLCDKTMFVMTKYFCRDKSIVVVTNTCLSQQAYFCRDKSFVATKLCLL